MVMSSERVVLLLDLENLMWDYWLEGSWSEAIRSLEAALTAAIDGRSVVHGSAAAAFNLAERLAVPLMEFGITTFVHGGGSNAADHALIAELERIKPRTYDSLIIGSGDRCFAHIAGRIRKLGKHVEIIARPGHLSQRLHDASERWHPVKPPDSHREFELLDIHAERIRELEHRVRKQEWRYERSISATRGHISGLREALGRLAADWPENSQETASLAAAKQLLVPKSMRKKHAASGFSEQG
jgi:hypothetical protein